MEQSNSILIVLVIYNIRLSDSLTYKSLLNSIEFCACNFNIIVVDNSEVQSEELLHNPNLKYVYNGNVNKLAGAYNRALQFAKEKNARWMLLLDQDTEITRDYFIALDVLLRDGFDTEVAAVAPTLTSNKKIISPIIQFNNFWLSKTVNNTGKQTGFVVALNSMTLVNVSFINMINGFSLNYPLDMLDYWLYLQIYKLKKKVFIIDVILDHNLSVLNYSQNISIERHGELLRSEASITREIGVICYLTFKLRLFFRFLKYMLMIKDKRYAKIILKLIFKVQ